MYFPPAYFQDEIREGFYIPGMTKRSWAAQMDVLEVVTKICDKHTIRWFAAYGTLIGAIRHRGFIPWDDDLDICMFRDDYERFNKIAKDELPKEYHLINIEGNVEYDNFLTRITSGNVLDFSTDYLMAHHGFPYVAGIDIFPLDYLYPDEKKEEERRTKADFLWKLCDNINHSRDMRSYEDIVSEIELVCGVRPDPNLSLSFSIPQIINSLMKECPKSRATHVTLMPIWITQKRQKLAISLFDITLDMPFENVSIKVPIGYDDILKECYGNWEKVTKAGGIHDYPYYSQHEKILRKEGKTLPYLLEFKDLPAKNYSERTKHKLESNTPQKIVDTLFSTNNYLRSLADTNEINSLVELCISSQQLAINLGTYIENNYCSSSPTISFIEQYCETLYQIVETISSNAENNMSALLTSSIAKLSDILTGINKSFSQNELSKKRYIFMPVKYDDWESMAAYFHEISKSKSNIIHVMPLPYAYRDDSGQALSLQSDFDLFPKDLPLLRYAEYDFNKLHADEIIFQNPYGKYESGLTVLPFFYPENLYKYTDCLVYIPWIKLDSYDFETNQKAFVNAKYYVLSSGVFFADKILISSEEEKSWYLKCLEECAIPKKTELESKFEILNVQLNVNEISRKEGKKNILFYISFSDFYFHSEKAIKKLKYSLDLFYINHEHINVFWLVDSTFEYNNAILSSKVQKELSEAKNLFISQDLGTIVGSFDSVDLSTLNGYYGSGSYIHSQCVQNKIPVMIRSLL